MRIICTVFFIALMLVGCAATTGQRKFTKDVDDVRVYSSECVFVTYEAYVPETAAMAALAGTLAPVVIEKGLDLVEAALRKAGEKSEFTKSAATTTNLLKHASKSGEVEAHLFQPPRCIDVVAARFSDVQLGDALHHPVNLAGAPLRPSAKTFLANRGVKGTPSMVLEVQVRPHPNVAVFRLVPTYLFYLRPLKKSSFSRKRDLLFSFTWKDLTLPTEKQSFALANILLPDMKPPVLLTGRALEGRATGWLTRPEPRAAVSAAQTTVVAYDKALETKQRARREAVEHDVAFENATLAVERIKGKQDPELTDASIRLKMITEDRARSKAISQMDLGLKELADATNSAQKLLTGELQPVTVDMTLTETRNARPILIAIADALKGSKDKIGPAVTEAIAPTPPTDTAVTQALAAKVATDKAIRDRAGLLGTIGATPALLADADDAILQKKLAENIAYKAAGLTPRWPDVFP